ASGPTVALVSGTGSVCIGRDNAQRIRRVGGRGYLVGDEGSGYWLGQQALAAALRGAEQLGPGTALTRIAAERFSTEDVAAWTQAIYLAPNPRQVIASFAPEVPAAAAAGDTQAEQILERASESLAQHVESVVESLAISGGAYTLVLAGSVLVHSEVLRHALTKKLQAAGIAPATTSVITSPAQSAAVERGRSTSPP
ncbi:MAG: BadF/BadG/BcrA/BcrD ATPase family protein, partial [Planctomycetota bacterium]